MMDHVKKSSRYCKAAEANIKKLEIGDEKQEERKRLSTEICEVEVAKKA